MNQMNIFSKKIGLILFSFLMSTPLASAASTQAPTKYSTACFLLNYRKNKAFEFIEKANNLLAQSLVNFQSSKAFSLLKELEYHHRWALHECNFTIQHPKWGLNPTELADIQGQCKDFLRTFEETKKSLKLKIVKKELLKEAPVIIACTLTLTCIIYKIYKTIKKKNAPKPPKTNKSEADATKKKDVQEEQSGDRQAAVNSPQN